MALSDVGLCARALIKIGALPITSFNDGTAESEIAGALFSQIRDALLSAYPWNFATAQISLNQLSEAPLADYGYAYQLPNDFLRALSVGANGHGRGLQYRIMGGALHTNAPEITLSYIYQPDEESFPPFFDQALIVRLAAEFTIPVTENTSRSESMFASAEREFKRARQIDAQQDTPNRIDDFNLVDIRG